MYMKKLNNNIVRPMRLTLLIIVLSWVVTGCGGGTAPYENPCITNPNLLGCSAADLTTSVSIDQASSPTLTSTLLHDLLDITQIALKTTLLTKEYKQQILAARDTQPQQRYANCGTPTDITSSAGNNTAYLENNLNACSEFATQITLPCDNGNQYNVFIKTTSPGYTLGGTIMQIVFSDQTQNINNQVDLARDPSMSCQIGTLHLGGIIQLAQINITDDPTNPDNWTQTSELYPTVTIYDFDQYDPNNDIANSDHWVDINNPLQIEASYNVDTGLTFTGTVMDNSAFFDPTSTSLNNLNGIEFSHYPPNTDPNDTATATYNNLRLGSTVTVQLNSTDPLTASLMTFSTTGTMATNRTGLDLDMSISTKDASGTAQPLTWAITPNIFGYIPKQAPPFRGNFRVDDKATGSQLVATVNTNASTDQDLNLLVTDNTLSVTDPAHITSTDTGWLVLLMNRL